MIAFLKLIRLPNLLIMAFTMYVVKYCLVQPIVEAGGLSLQMPDLYFFLLVLSIVMIGAAGYIINDYFDIKIDRVNKPDDIVVDKGIKRRVAMGAHTVINVLGVALGIFVSYKANFLKLGGILFLFSATSLWFYSTTFKRQFLVGNLVISILSGIVPILAGLYEMRYVNEKYASTIPEQLPMLNNTIFWFVSGFAFFAFILTLLREVIKDTEDREGDEEFGCKTLPVVMGVKGARIVSVVISIFILGLISYLNTDFYSDPRSALAFWYITILLELPLAILTFILIRSKEKSDFRRASRMTKFIMLSGICFWFVLKYQAETGNWLFG